LEAVWSMDDGPPPECETNEGAPTTSKSLQLLPQGNTEAVAGNLEITPSAGGSWFLRKRVMSMACTCPAHPSRHIRYRLRRLQMGGLEYLSYCVSVCTELRRYGTGSGMDAKCSTIPVCAASALRSESKAFDIPAMSMAHCVFDGGRTWPSFGEPDKRKQMPAQR